MSRGRWRYRALAAGVIVTAATAATAVIAVGLAAFPDLRTRALRGAHRRWTTLTHRAPGRPGVEVVRSYPHDPEAFTQGLLLDGELLYESTGLLGQSTLRRVDLQTGRVLHSVALPQTSFGEGLAMASGRLIQLTWKEETAFVYDQRSPALGPRLLCAGGRWGLLLCR